MIIVACPHQKPVILLPGLQAVWNLYQEAQGLLSSLWLPEASLPPCPCDSWFLLSSLAYGFLGGQKCLSLPDTALRPDGLQEVCSYPPEYPWLGEPGCSFHGAYRSGGESTASARNTSVTSQPCLQCHQQGCRDIQLRQTGPLLSTN